MPEFLELSRNVQIPLGEFEFTFARSGGPGGQNVNKVSSKATLRWDITNSTSIPEPVKQRFLDTYGTRVTTEGVLVLTSQRYRDQTANIDDCLEKLREMLLAVLIPPKKRRPTKPTLASKERRVKSKRERSETKQRRRSPLNLD